MLITTFIACPKRQEQIRPTDAQEAFNQALRYKKEKRFRAAEDAFTYVIFNFPGSSLAADAQFELADCYFESKDFEQAQKEFNFYLQNFPNGRYQEEAAFKLGIAVFRSAPTPDKDQSQVKKAQELLSDFLTDYPESRFRSAAESALTEIASRLAHREIAAARLYFKAGEFKSALVYYEFVKENYPASLWSEEDRYQLAVCYAETGEPEKARPLLEEIVEKNSSPRLRRAAQQYLNRLK